MKWEGEPLMMEFEKNILTMNLPQYSLPINHIWFQTEISRDDITFTSANFSAQFDLVLSRDFPEDKTEQWSLISLEGENELSKIVLGSVDTHSRSDQTIDFQYKISSKNGILSSGTMTLNYTPIPGDFELTQAYPNPFNPITTIEYAMPEDAEIVLSIYNVQGRLVTDITHGLQPAGYHKTVWDGAQYASGLYFIRMTVYDLENRLQFNKLQKIMLLK